MTVAQLTDNMDIAEEAEWYEHFEIRAEELEAQREKAAAERKRKV